MNMLSQTGLAQSMQHRHALNPQFRGYEQQPRYTLDGTWTDASRGHHLGHNHEQLDQPLPSYNDVLRYAYHSSPYQQPIIKPLEAEDGLGKCRSDQYHPLLARCPGHTRQTYTSYQTHVQETPVPDSSQQRRIFPNSVTSRPRGACEFSKDHRQCRPVATGYGCANNDDSESFAFSVSRHNHNDKSSTYAPNGLNISYGSKHHKKCIGISNIPGEGLHYLYDDGSRCPTQVAGEHVNPAWGLTKANKPRKRLAVACLNCREKKTKCDSGQSRCSQCQKGGRQCTK